MPSVRPQRQPGAGLDWYGSSAGEDLLQAEQAATARMLGACAGPRWAWLGVRAAAAPPLPPGATARQAVLLHRTATGFEGTVRCALPLPFASESLSLVLIQHALDDAVAVNGVLAECERVLMPGGRLWLAVLNPWSPYRALWMRSGLRAHDPGYWQARLRAAGFATDGVSVQWFGPRWRRERGDAGVGALDRLRAGVALTIDKRVRAVIPPTRLAALRLQPGARYASPIARHTAHDRDGDLLP